MGRLARLVKSHLSRQLPTAAESGAADVEGVLAEISRRRNRIEDALRDLLRDGLRFSEGSKAMNVALSCLPEDRRAVLAQYGYNDFWVELYFNELLSILHKNFGAFQKRMERGKDDVMKWMDQVNRCRADAHARARGEENLAFLRVCFGRLEVLLDLH